MGCKYFHKDFVEISFHYEECTSHLVPLAKGLNNLSVWPLLRFLAKYQCFPSVICKMKACDLLPLSCFLETYLKAYLSHFQLYKRCQILRFISFLETLGGRVS